MTGLYVGLMSGTSMDGIDAVLVELDAAGIEVLAHRCNAYPGALAAALRAAAALPLDRPVDPGGRLDVAVGEAFRDATLDLLDAAGVSAGEVTAIGSHGQTLRHAPDADPPFSLQVGNADIIAAGTGITTVADFRTADIAAGGQGAPLVPPFHDWLLRDPDRDRAVVNIGGIANVTALPAEGAVSGFDTGPGNGLMDAWIRRHRGERFDSDGAWAAAGEVDERLLSRMLADPYFALPAPKSTGFEYFNPAWIDRHAVGDLAPVNVQATLCELTARSIATAIHTAAPGCREVFVCGGGVHNRSLLARLELQLPAASLASTAAAGLDPDWVEACAFAWLAMRRLAGLPGNLPSVTGARHPVTLGEIHYA